jgi:glycosyltransferase involved in cell wall biosynthesis
VRPPPIIGALGNWTIPTKGLDVLLRAFWLLVENWQHSAPVPMLRIMGRVEGWGARCYDEIKRTLPASVTERVTLDGAVHEYAVIRRMSECAIGVIPSIWEACPNTLYEWVASGRPTVTTRTGAMPDITPYPDLITEPGDVLDMAKAMERAVLDAQANTYNGEEIAGKFIAHYTPEREAAQYHDFYQQILKRKA